MSTHSTTIPGELSAPVGHPWLARLLRPFVHAEPREALPALALTCTGFLLLLAYYLLKTAREPLILLHGGAEVKAYASAGQAMLLMAVVPAYAALARRVSRVRLLACVYGFFALHLFGFAALVDTDVPLGVAFYLWVGVFNVVAITQVWSFANDLYTPEQGKRLLAMLGIGASLGAVVGSLVAKSLSHLGPKPMMLSAALVLIACIGVVGFVDRQDAREREAEAAKPEETPVASRGASVWSVVLGDRYFALIALLTLVINCIGTSGEYILDRTLLAAIAEGQVPVSEQTAFIGAFKSDFYAWVNLLGVVIQLFLVSRVLTWFGVRKTLFVLPLFAFGSYALMAALPVLSLIRLGKIAENSLSYSLHNTSRHALFLVGSRADKYVGKTFIDTFCVRLGDVVAAGLIWGGAVLSLSAQAFAGVNVVLIAVWLGLLVVIGREHAARERVLSEG